MADTTISLYRQDLRRPLPVAAKLGLAREIVTVYVRVRWLLWRRGLPSALRALRRPTTDPHPEDALARKLTGIRLGRAVGRTLAVLPFDSRCLVRSLVLATLLAKRGIESAVVIGVKSEPAFAAHAWVELDGAPLLPSGEPTYRRLVEL